MKLLATSVSLLAFSIIAEVLSEEVWDAIGSADACLNSWYFWEVFVSSLKGWNKYV